MVALFCKILCGRVDQFAFTWVNVLVKLKQTPYRYYYFYFVQNANKD